jgi:hypothetical protein
MLHPTNIAFLKEIQDSAPGSTGRCHELLDLTHGDVVDAVRTAFACMRKNISDVQQLAALDRLDGGFSLFICCPGALPAKPEFAPEDITLRCYVPPREIGIVGGADDHITKILRYFVENIAFHHLRRLKERSSVAKIPALDAKRQISSRLFPSPTTPGTCHFDFISGGVKYESFDAEIGSLSDAHQELVHTAPSRSPSPDFIPFEMLPTEEAPLKALLSIGTETDKVIKSLQLDRRIFPCLRYLIRTTPSGSWENEMKKDVWGLNRQQAAMISGALLKDLTHAKSPALEVHDAY